MMDVLQRIFIFTLAGALISYFIFMVIGATFYAKADEASRTVWVRDEISPNTHRLAGLVTVESTCLELIEKTEKLSDTLYKLKFTTWENPNIECIKEPTRKLFYEVIFAPAVGVHFIATLDDVSLPMIVVPYTP